MQRIAHLGAQRVPRAQAARPYAQVGARVQQRVPQRRGPPRRGEQLVPVLAGVAGAADDQLVAVPAGHRVAHVVVVGRHAETGEQLGRARALHGQHAEVAVLVGDRDGVRGRPGQPADHLGGVRRVRHQEDVVVVEQVRDEVVDHAAGRRVAAQRVLRPAGTDPAQVVAQRGVEEVDRPGAAHPGLAQVGDVEDADRLPHRGVLPQHAAAGGAVLDRHLPATEVGELGAEGDVPVVQGRAQQVGRHARSLAARPARAAPGTPAGVTA